jgi:hypothetical protein
MVIITRRGWRSGVELALFVSSLVLGVGLLLLTSVAPALASPVVGSPSASLVWTAHDAPVPNQWTAHGFAASSRDDADDDDDITDGDDVGMPLIVVGAEPHVDRAAGWLAADDAVAPPVSLASGAHSLRAPPQ